MYAAYQFKNIEKYSNHELLEAAKTKERENTEKVLAALDSFVTPKGEIDAASMMAEWFSGIRADVFISHSRADKDAALTLSGLLSEVFGLTAFVDSCVWGHANKLLREIDESFCRTGPNQYSYQRSTVTANHVHMMLGTALTKMMDQCECVFFLNSENSVKSISVEGMVESDDEGITQSPWLFHEISMMSLLRRREKGDHRPGHVKKADFSESVASLPRFNYPVTLDGITVLGLEELGEWIEKWSKRQERTGHALDFLYEQRPPHPNRALHG